LAAHVSESLIFVSSFLPIITSIRSISLPSMSVGCGRLPVLIFLGVFSSVTQRLSYPLSPCSFFSVVRFLKDRM
jgi:hypothetical protein